MIWHRRTPPVHGVASRLSGVWAAFGRFRRLGRPWRAWAGFAVCAGAGGGWGTGVGARGAAGSGGRIASELGFELARIVRRRRPAVLAAWPAFVRRAAKAVASPFLVEANMLSPAEGPDFVIGRGSVRPRAIGPKGAGRESPAGRDAGGRGRARRLFGRRRRVHGGAAEDRGAIGGRDRGRQPGRHPGGRGVARVREVRDDGAVRRAVPRQPLHRGRAADDRRPAPLSRLGADQGDRARVRVAHRRSLRHRDAGDPGPRSGPDQRGPRHRAVARPRHPLGVERAA